MPPIAPPDMPFFASDTGAALELGVVVAEMLAAVALESEDADKETGSEVVGVAVA